MQVSGCEKLKPLPPFRLCQGECQLQELAQQGRGREPKCKNRGEDLLLPLSCLCHPAPLSNGNMTEKRLSSVRPLLEKHQNESEAFKLRCFPPMSMRCGVGGRRKAHLCVPTMSPVLLGRRGSLLETLRVQDYILWVYRNRKC